MQPNNIHDYSVMLKTKQNKFKKDVPIKNQHLINTFYTTTYNRIYLQLGPIMYK